MFEAVALVGLVVLIFLQDWKAMILPMIDVPVSIIGTFAVMAAMGFSLNNISLFGLVLAIGIVVDDAIVVLENIERMLARGHDVRTATIKAMEEVTGPIIAVALVLCAVFVPCAFIERHHRAVLPPVRRDDLRLDAHLRDQRDHHDPVAGRAALQDRRGTARPTSIAARPCPGGSSAWRAGCVTRLVGAASSGRSFRPGLAGTGQGAAGAVRAGLPGIVPAVCFMPGGLAGRRRRLVRHRPGERRAGLAAFGVSTDCFDRMSVGLRLVRGLVAARQRGRAGWSTAVCWR